MRKQYLAFFGCLVLIIMLAGCSHPVYKIWIESVTINDNNPVYVDEQAIIYLNLTQINKSPSVDVAYVWEIEGMEPITTDRSYLVIMFGQVGLKHCKVRAVINDKDYLTNEYEFSIDVTSNIAD